jgi:hypothetical protein
MADDGKTEERIANGLQPIAGTKSVVREAYLGGDKSVWLMAYSW